MARTDEGNRDPRAEGAAFEAVRVRGGGRSGWLSLLVLPVVLGLLVIGGLPGGPADPQRPLASLAVAVAVPSGTRPLDVPALATAAPSTVTPRPGPTGDVGPRPRPAGQLLRLDLRPAGSHLFVHGDVFSLSVHAVSVSLIDAEGAVAERERVRMPGGSRSFWTDANARFDVHFAIPDEMMGDGLSIEVSAFDTDGGELGTFRELVTSPLGPF